MKRARILAGVLVLLAAVVWAQPAANYLTVLLGTAGSAAGSLTFFNASNSNSATLQGGVTTTTYTLKLPPTKGTSGQALTTDGNNPAQLDWTTITPTHAMLSASVTDSTPGTVVRGDLITGQGASPTWTRLAKGSAYQGLHMDASATDIVWAALALDQAAAVSGILPGGNGGTGNGFFAVSGPASTLKTFTFPNASATVLTDNAAVTVAQGGTGITSGTSGGVPYFSASGTIASSGALGAGQVVLGGGAGATPTTDSDCSFATDTLTCTKFRTGSNTLGFGLVDTGSNHFMLEVYNEDASANRTLNWILGNADRTITLSGNPTLADWFDQAVKQASSPTFAGATFSGAVGFANGTVGAPSISFTSDLASGIFWSVVNDAMYFVDSGVGVMKIEFGLGGAILKDDAYYAWSSSGIDSALDLYLSRGGAATLQLGAANSASPVNQILRAQGGAGTDIAGGRLTLLGGLGSGAGVPGALVLQTGQALGTGTTTQTAYDRLWVEGRFKTLADASATALVSIAVPSNATAGGVLFYAVEATASSNWQMRGGSVAYSITNEGGTEVCTFGTASDGDGTPTGTLTLTFDCDTSGTNTAVIRINADSSLTTPTIVGGWSLMRNRGTGAITPQ